MTQEQNKVEHPSETEAQKAKDRELLMEYLTKWNDTGQKDNLYLFVETFLTEKYKP